MTIPWWGSKTLGRLQKHEKIEKITSSQDDESVGEPKDKPQVPPLRSPGFPVEVGGVGELPAAFLTESRTRGRQ